jgi:peptidoglycan hydrolase-like protein with peptidoglycan-binding domain
MRRTVLVALIALGLSAALSVGQGAAADGPADGFATGRLGLVLDEVRRRAEAGDAAAEYLYGRRYEEGDGVLQDPAAAHMWYDRAARHGSADAAAARARLAAVMTAEQLARAEGMAGRRLAVGAPAASPAAPAPAADRITGRDVAEAQRRLKALGYDLGAADGKAGPRTRAAVRAYQQQAGLPATGEIDRAVVAALARPPERATVATGDSAGFLPNEDSMVDSGRLAEAVREVQGQLRRRGYWRGPEADAVSPALRQAIAAYQADAGLPATGQVSERLLDHLRYARPEVTPQQARAR